MPVQKSRAAQQSLNTGFLAAEAFVEHNWIIAAALGENVFPEAFCYFGIEDAFLLEELKSIGIENFRPFVAVIAR